jgi:ATP-dependent RNA helicase RhlE
MFPGSSGPAAIVLPFLRQTWYNRAIMSDDFKYPIGGKDFRAGKPVFFNRRKKRRAAASVPRHPGLAEKDVPVPPLPQTPPPAAYAANVFGRFDVRLQHALADASYAVPTPIQEQAIPPVLEGHDLVGRAQTGTGKTAAFILPILARLLEKGPQPPEKGGAGHPRALVLSPTRELAAQIAENTAAYAKYAGIPFAVVFGGVSQFPQVRALQKGADIVIATPGRLIDLMTQGVVYLDRVEMFVLDEADRMLDMGFLPDIKRLISKLPPNRPVAGGAHGASFSARQSLFFSATLSPQIRSLAGELVRDPVEVTVSPETPTVEKIEQCCMMVDKGNKDNLLLHLLEQHPEWYRVIVFARTRHGADRVERKLTRSGIPVAAIHSDKSQNQRLRALSGFKSGKTRVLVATDIASRGIDVPAVDVVVNMELPVETESYVHRIGRTARAGSSGAAISFVSPDEHARLKAVERFIRKTVRLERDHPFHCEAAERKTGKTQEGLPQAPWIRGAATNKKGVARHPGAHFFGKGAPDGAKKKFIHPANAKRSRPARKNYQGRREPDFGQK